MFFEAKKTFSNLVAGRTALDFAEQDVHVKAGEGEFSLGSLIEYVVGTDPMKPVVTLWTGAGTPVGVLLGYGSADATNERAPAIVRGSAILIYQGIAWPVGATQVQKDAAITALHARNITIRQGV